MVQTTGFKTHHLVGVGIAAGLAGGLTGAWYVKQLNQERKKSEAERVYPNLVKEVCEEIAPILDDWEPDDNLDDEDSLVRDLQDHLRAHTHRSVVLRARLNLEAEDGFPDLLIDGVLALEMKHCPIATERDRLIGQCLKYAKKTVTWVVLTDTPDRVVNKIEDLLEDNGLGRILVWNFFAQEEDDDDDGYDADDDDDDDYEDD